MPAPQVDSERKIPESQESRRQRQEEEPRTTGVRAGSSLASSQTSILTGGAGNFRPEPGDRHFRLMPPPPRLPQHTFFDYSAPDAFTKLAMFALFSLPFPGDLCPVLTPDVDYMAQHPLRKVDFRVKRSALDASPWKRWVWSRGAPGYARWELWGLGLCRGPFCRGLPELGVAWKLTEAVFSPLQLGAWRGTRRLGSIKPFGDDGFLQPLPPNDTPWRLRPPRCSCCFPFQPNVPIAPRATAVLPPQRLMKVEVRAP